jgi:hypothetical protein
MPHQEASHNHLLVPRGNLGRFVVDQAEKAKVEHRISYVPSSAAPSTYPSLRVAYRTAVGDGTPFPVSPAHCQQTMFTRPQFNWAFRFVHDLEHVARALTFSVEDELVMGMYHLEALRAAGYVPDSPEHKLLHADTIGQTYCFALLGRFPYNQRRFDYDCVDLCVDAAVELEAARPAPTA